MFTSRLDVDGEGDFFRIDLKQKTSKSKVSLRDSFNYLIMMTYHVTMVTKMHDKAVKNHISRMQAHND